MGLYEDLQALVGGSSGEPAVGLDEVNAPMIRHMVVALGDRNLIYVDHEAAKAAGHPGIVAPPTMLQTWSMAGLDGTGRVGAWGKALDLLDEAGFGSTVAVNCEQEYFRYLVRGDRVTVTGVLDSVSQEKHTALGIGHFVTTRDEYRDGDGELVGTHLFRVLKFKPGTGTQAPRPAETSPRPRPAITRDTAWWFKAAHDDRLLIQRCTDCGRLRHPPGPACPECHSFGWETIEASGRATVFSWVVVHHPQAPSFDYPLPVVLAQLEEGTRLIGNLVDCEFDEIEIGMPIVCELVAIDDDFTIPRFRRA